MARCPSREDEASEKTPAGPHRGSGPQQLRSALRQTHRDHGSLLASLTALCELVQGGVQPNPEAIVRQLMAIGASVKRQLTAEDACFIRRWPISEPPRGAGRKRFQQEIGGIAGAYGSFASRWNVPAQLAADPQGFGDGADAVFKAPHPRIQHEGQEIYPPAAEV